MTVLSGNRSTVTSFKLDYVKPTTEGVVEFSSADLDEGAMIWKNALIGYTVGDLPQFKEVVDFVHKFWSEYQIPRIHLLKQGVFLFDFDSEEAKNQILARHWSFNLTNLVLMEWTPDFHVDDDSPHLVPVWVKFPNLPFRFWSKRNLSKIASAIGRPVSIDAFTAQREVLKYARVLVELEIGAPLKSSIQFKFPDGSMYDQNVVYEWIPIQCPTCKLCGHKGEDCPQGQEIGVQSSVNTNSAPFARSNVVQVSVGSNASSPAHNVQVNVSNALLESQEAVSQSGVSGNDVLEQLLPEPSDLVVTAGVAPEGSRNDARQYDTKINDLLAPEGQDFTPKSNPFGAAFGNAATTPANSSFSMSVPSGELFRPPPTQPTGFGSGGFGAGTATQAPAPVPGGFGKPAQLGAGQQALGSVLGAFGQSLQIGTGLPNSGFAPASNFGSGFSSSPAAGGLSSSASGGGFSALASGGSGGFAAMASQSGGFGGAAAGGGGGFAAAAPGSGGFGGAAAGGGGGFAAAAPGSGGFGGAAGGVGGFTAAAPGSGGFGGAAAGGGGGFAAVAPGGRGFAGAAPAGGSLGAFGNQQGGGFAALASGGSGGFAAMASQSGGFGGGLGAFGNQQGANAGGFCAFSGSNKPPPPNLFQMRK